MSSPTFSNNDGASTPRLYSSEAIASVMAAVRDPQHPTQIGPYHVEQLIGEGGMGSVYRAVQRDPIQRAVAIKVVKLGMDTREVIARFSSERQALAMMDHPNVAKVLEAGATESGRPYFVMELVQGEPITSYADRQQLTVRQRLDLFTQACEAVQHAHTKGIIHRDLKPSNILVTMTDGAATVKVIDFGVAKAIGQPLGEKSLHTEAGQLLGTPEYMAPEQAEGKLRDVDTRTDVFSLGVVLYELLIGALPFDANTLRGGGYYEAQRIIREVEPPRPSTRLSSLGKHAQEIAGTRRTPLHALHRQLKCELEWIPLKAMRKEPARRYSSPRELSEDIENYLANRPLRAGPESRAYWARKFLRRNKVGVAASAGMLLLLLGGIITTSWQAIRATHAEARAVQERDNAEATVEFLTNDVLSGATPDKIPDHQVRDQIVKAMIAPAADRVGQQFHDRPVIEASIRKTIARVLMEIGRRDLALPQAEAAVALDRRVLGENHPDTLSSLNQYAQALEANGRVADAEPIFRRLLDQRRQSLGADDAQSLVSLNNYAHVLYAQGRWQEAAPLYEELVERRRRVSGDDDPLTITAVSNYAAALRSMDRIPEAAPLFKEALDRCRHVLGEDNPQTIAAINNYAYVLKSLNRRDEAAPLFKETLDRRRRVLGEDHPDAIWSQSEYALVLQSQGKLDEAEALLKRSLEQSRRVLGPDHDLSVRILNNYAGFLVATVRVAKAEPLIKEALERRRRILGEHHPETLIAMNNYASVLARLGRAAEAEPLAREALRVSTTHPSLGPTHRQTQGLATTYAKILDRLDRHDDAAAVRTEYHLSQPATHPASSQGSR